jgi:endo-1,4-beta-D-glucanase Y
MSQTPAPGYGSPIATEAAPDASTCNQFALHSTGSGFDTPDLGQFAGFGAFFVPHVPYDKISNAYDVSNYMGISFKMKSGGGTPPAVFFEVLTKESLPTNAGGIASDPAIDLYNTRGQLLNAPWAPNDISTTYQTFTVPFGTLVPRWLPSPYGWPYTYCCSYSGASVPKCQAKPFVPQDVLGIRISMYVPDVTNGFPEPAGSTIGTYDLWIDDVMFVKDDSGLQTRAGFPLASPGKFGNCIMPRGPSADAKFLVSAYNQWKANFVKDNKVIRPEYQDDGLSESIAFGMMIAVNMNDQALFDSLYGTWKSNPVTGAATLMRSCLGSVVGSNTAVCGLTDYSATGADEDAAYALLMAGKLWGGTYQADAIAMLKDIWDKDIDGAGTLLPKGGSNYQSPTGTGPWQITSASYFAPSFYRVFASVDTDVSHDWAGVITAVYKVINGPISGSNGLIPAWCGNSCTVAASNGMATDVVYQYDSHRIPMRIGLDYCFNGTAEAKAYADLITGFFAGLGKAGLGIGQIADMYTPSGGGVFPTSANSASVLGTAAVGAMASGEQTFLNEAYQTVFDLATRGTMAPMLYRSPDPTPGPLPTYSYYNATVGLLTLLIMTGNFMH